MPIFGCGLGSIIPHGSISLLVTFRTLENYHMESIIFNIVEVNHPFNDIIGRPALYQFVAITHYRYLVLKMPSPNDIIMIHGDRSTGVSTLEKLQALAVAHEAITGWERLTKHHQAHASASHLLHPAAALGW
jgi:hypothetical protein